jgi:opacity protein-like surface antigen
MRILIRSFAVLALLVASAVSTASAQVFDFSGQQRQQRPAYRFAGVAFHVADPVGEFDRFVDVGYGIGGHFVWTLDRSRIFGLRADVGFVQYGHERKRVPLSNTIGGRIMVDVNTDNNIVMFGVGPQIMAPSGSIRPYANGGIGLAYFATQSSVGGSSDEFDFASTTNFDDATFAWNAGGGVLIPVRKGLRPILIDVGARFQGNGEARYLKEGSIEDNSDGTISFTPIRSETNLVTYHLGVSFGF